MTRIVIQPRDPLIVRDGRPFTADPGARARSLGFPMPSTIIGAIRTLAGSNSSGEFVQTSKPELKALLEDVALLGPLLVEQNKNDWNILAPSPADALGLEDTSKTVALRKLQPLQISQTMLCDLETGLHPVGLHPADSKAKPTKLPRLPKRVDKGLPHLGQASSNSSWVTSLRAPCGRSSTS